MSGALPAALRASSLVLAKPVARVPGPAVPPGSCIYELKWDGFRASVTVEDAGVTIWSRQGKDLTRYFPELAAAAREHIPAGCVIDGEALIWSADRLDFNALETRCMNRYQSGNSRPAAPSVNLKEKSASHVLKGPGHHEVVNAKTQGKGERG